MLPAAQQLPKLSSPPYTPLHGDPGMVQIAALLPQECGLEVVSRQPSLVATSKHSRFSPATCASLRTARWLGYRAAYEQPQGSGSRTGRVPRLHHRPDAAAVAAANVLGVAGAGTSPANAARQKLPPSCPPCLTRNVRIRPVAPAANSPGSRRIPRPQRRAAAARPLLPQHSSRCCWAALPATAAPYRPPPLLLRTCGHSRASQRRPQPAAQRAHRRPQRAAAALCTQRTHSPSEPLQSGGHVAIRAAELTTRPPPSSAACPRPATAPQPVLSVHTSGHNTTPATDCAALMAVAAPRCPSPPHTPWAAPSTAAHT